MQAERLTISKDLKTGYSECWLIRRNQRFIRFTIGNDLKLYVYAPKNASIEEIETALNKEAAGIPLLLKRKKVSLLEDIKKLQAIMKLENELGDDISYFEYLPKEEFEKRTEEFLPIITAKVEIDGEEIRILVDQSVDGIRYGFFNYGKVNLYNAAGLPLCPFRRMKY